jgi:hypothetical protein
MTQNIYFQGLKAIVHCFIKQLFTKHLQKFNGQQNPQKLFYTFRPYFHLHNPTPPQI